MCEAKSSVLESEVEKFTIYAAKWWEPKKKTKFLLQTISEIRIPLIKNGLIDAGLVKAENKDKSNIFKGIKILDVGSGGGRMAEPLALMGADVTGVDPTKKMVDVAKEHLKTHENLKMDYICDTVENYNTQNKEKFDAVTIFDVTQHVSDVRQLLKASVDCIKPGGRVFITTWNKTFVAWFFLIFLFEWLFGIFPKGAHDFKYFITPDTISKYLEEFDCETTEVKGFWYNLWNKKWNFTSYTGVFYTMQAVKKK